ncbi:MAG TPA: GNAT family N-acetyltransferase [Bradyrhizobium sp.]|nr:GNAT family N-acetyltransferase [Bradyrhizobium sp.]
MGLHQPGAEVTKLVLYRNDCSLEGLDTPVADLACPRSNWTIRPFQHGDAPGARRLIETVWHEHFDRHPDPFVRNFITSRLSDVDNAETAYRDRAIFLCAIGEAGIIGTGAIKPLDHRACEMARMFVAAACRGRGVGRAIADELIKFARSAGYDQVYLSSNNALAASHRLYESMGFQSTPPWEPGGETHSRYYALRIGRGVG